jgi:hypothetical protein
MSELLTTTLGSVEPTSLIIIEAMTILYSKRINKESNVLIGA